MCADDRQQLSDDRNTEDSDFNQSTSTAATANNLIDNRQPAFIVATAIVDFSER